MKNVDRWFILMAAAYALLGMCLGFWMGVNQDFTHAHVHAHINLLGWASLALFGIIYKVYPELASKPLTKVHFYLSAIGAPIFFAGIPVANAGTTILPAVVGSLMLIASMLVFLVNFSGGTR
ncbi:MAG: cytochrome-c oxidase [Pseudomonadota bacterium]|nr:cytochrome-c oxidase [Pseudomonadota bacterium]